MFAHFWDHQHIGVAVLNVRASVAQMLRHENAGAFAHVVHIALLGDAERQNFCPLQRLVDGVLRHGCVDLFREFNEPRMQAVFARVPREVKRMDESAVTADAGIIGREAEGLGFGGVNSLNDINAHGVGHDLQFMSMMDITKLRSDTREASKGVGTQIKITSQAEICEKPVVDTNPGPSAATISLDPMCAIGLVQALMPPTRSQRISNPKNFEHLLKDSQRQRDNNVSQTNYTGLRFAIFDVRDVAMSCVSCALARSTNWLQP